MKENLFYKLFKSIIKLLYTLVISFICIIGLLLIIYIIMSQVNSKNKEYKPIISLYTIVSPSMNPVIKVYDVVVNIRVNKPQDIKVGDIITYISASSSSSGMTITHRVIEVVDLGNGNYEYITQGDNNKERDSSNVEFNKIIGKEILIIPSLGKVQFLIANDKSWLLILLIPVIIYLFFDLKKITSMIGLRNKVVEVSNTEPIKDNNTYYNVPKSNVIKSNIDILDTDELSSKVKEYNDKIAELDTMINKIKIDNSIIEDNFVEQDDFLKGGKIKVINIENINHQNQNEEYSFEAKYDNPKKIDILKNKKVELKKIEKLKLNPDVLPKIRRPGKEIVSKDKPKSKKIFTIEKEK